MECISETHPAAVVLRASRASPSAEDSALDSMTDQDVSTALAALREDVERLSTTRRLAVTLQGNRRAHQLSARHRHVTASSRT